MGWLDRQLPPASSSQTIVRRARRMPTPAKGKGLDDAGLLLDEGSAR